VDLDAFVGGYIDCALWATNDNGYLGEGHPDNQLDENGYCGRDDGGDPLEDNFGPDDLAPEALAEVKKDCENFLGYCADLGISLDEWSAEEAGHDFFLTRNGHGTGFWDRGRDAGELLSKAAKTFGSQDFYVGDDGKVYVS